MFESMLCKVHPELYYSNLPDLTHKDGPNLDGKLAHLRLGCGNLKLTVQEEGGLV